MEHDEKCRSCAFFPCLRNTCNIVNKEGCDNYQSITQKALNEIDKKLEWKSMKKGKKVLFLYGRLRYKDKAIIYCKLHKCYLDRGQIYQKRYKCLNCKHREDPQNTF